jgi:hypothetical protein
MDGRFSRQTLMSIADLRLCLVVQHDYTKM